MRASKGGAEERRAFPFFPRRSHAYCSRVTSHDFPKWRACSQVISTAHTPFKIWMLHVVSLRSKQTNTALFSNSLNICTGRRCPPVIRVSGVKKSYLSEDLFTDGKRQIQGSRDVIFHDPGHTLVEKWVHRFNITQVTETEITQVKSP